MAYVTTLTVFEGLKLAIGDKNPHAFDRSVNVVSIWVMAKLLSLMAAVLISVGLHGRWAVEKIFHWQPLLRWMAVSLLVWADRWLVSGAYRTDVAPAILVMFAYTCPPVAALMSCRIFKRPYGALEWLSMGMITLSALAFIMIREWYVAGGTLEQKEWIDAHWRPFGVLLMTCAVFVRCSSWVAAEWIFKGGSTNGLASKWAVGYDKFYLMKVHLDFSALAILVCVWLVPPKLFYTQADSMAIPVYEVWFGTWRPRDYAMVCILACQDWFAGLITKEVNAVARFLVATFASLVTILLLDPLSSNRYMFNLRATPSVLLTVIVVMSTIIFQTGRKNIKSSRQRQVSDASGLSASELNAMSRIGSPGSHGEHSVTTSGQPFRTGADPGHRARHHRRRRAQAKIRSVYSIACKYVLVLTYILVDTGRSLLYSFALASTSINPTTMVMLMSACGVVLASALTAVEERKEGLRSAWDPWKILVSFPSALLFAVGQCLTSFAYALKVSPALVNVLGKIYTPIAAFGARCILPRPERPMSWLEYFAIIILTLASLTFGYLQEFNIETGFKAASIAAMLCVMGSAACSALGSLTAERIYKAERAKFIVQKVRLDFGSIITSLALLPLISLISSRAVDSIWIWRPMDAHCPAVCQPQITQQFPHWPWEEDYRDACAQPECTGQCACVPSVFAGWNEPVLFAALVVNIGHAWLIGKITKNFSTIHRAIADAFSTLLLYWLGDPLVSKLLTGSTFGKSISDSALDMVSFIVPLSTVTFMVAANEMRTAAEMRSAQMGTMQIAGSIETAGSGSQESSEEVPEDDDDDFGSDGFSETESDIPSDGASDSSESI